MSDSWQSLSDDLIEAWKAAERSEQAAKDFSDERLVNGQLLVTPKQYRELLKLAVLRPVGYPLGHPLYVTPLYEIPVLVIPDDGVAHDVGNGMKAVIWDGAIYVGTKGVFDDQRL